MSDIKMAELFKLPISPIKGLGQTFIDRGLMLCDAEADAACVAVNSHDKLTAQVAELRAVVYEANKYLDINNLTTIGHGSNLHEWFKQALELSK